MTARRTVSVGIAAVDFNLTNTGTHREPHHMWLCGSCGASVPEVTHHMHAAFHIGRTRSPHDSV